MNKLKKLGLTALCLACVSSVNASTIEEVSTEKLHTKREIRRLERLPCLASRDGNGGRPDHLRRDEVACRRQNADFHRRRRNCKQPLRTGCNGSLAAVAETKDWLRFVHRVYRCL